MMSSEVTSSYTVLWFKDEDEIPSDDEAFRQTRVQCGAGRGTVQGAGQGMGQGGGPGEGGGAAAGDCGDLCGRHGGVPVCCAG